MTKKIDTGGPAYPEEKTIVLPNGYEHTRPVPGMTWLDAAAIEICSRLVTQYDLNSGSIKNIVADAYTVAQALLAEKRRIERGEE